MNGVATDTWKYGYDAGDRLVSVRRRLGSWPADSVVARYGYDVLGRRVVKRVYSASTPAPQAYTRFSYAGNQVAFETDSGTVGITGNRYTWGLDVDDLVGFRTSSGVDYVVVQDQLRSVRGLVKRDGTWSMSQRFTPYGKLLSTSGAAPALSYGWTGREYDQETGFYFNRARYYDPGQRRFTQEDPVGYDGGPNLYAYVDGRVWSSPGFAER